MSVNNFISWGALIASGLACFLVVYRINEDISVQWAMFASLLLVLHKVYDDRGESNDG